MANESTLIAGVRTKVTREGMGAESAVDFSPLQSMKDWAWMDDGRKAQLNWSRDFQEV